MRVAVLDLYNNEENEGMRCLLQLLENFKKETSIPLTYRVFDVRSKLEIADLSYDTYISSGGPGSPLDSEGSSWEKNYFGLMNNVILHNRKHPEAQKHVLLICHSFQIFCRHYQYAKVKQRKSTAFGIMPVHTTSLGENEELLSGLQNPFLAVDSRDYQVLQPNLAKLKQENGYVACIEKERPLIKLERAVMAIRFNEAIFGTQFHGEADNQSMEMYLHRDDKAEYIKKRYGIRKYKHMLGLLEDGLLLPTYDTIIPKFLSIASRATTPQDL